MRSCRLCGQSFAITEEDQAFFDRMNVPGPTLCPEDIARTRLSFRNEVDLYRRTCDKTGQPILTYHPEHAPYPVYARDVWWSDAWDALDYGRDVDLQRPMLEQFTELSNVVPRSSIYVVESQNSEYTNYATHNKNCYLVFGTWFSEDCLYGQSMYHSTGCMDCHFVQKCQYCYGCVDCNECYETFYSENSTGCRNSWFLYDCRNCSNCIGCWNLRNKEYWIWNKPSTKEEYEKTAKELRSRKAIQQAAERFRSGVATEAIHKFMTGEGNESVSGDFIDHSKNIVNSYNVRECEEIHHSDRTLQQKDQYYCTGVHFGELAYNCLNADFSHTIISCMNGEHLVNCAYCFDCQSVEHCCLCIGVRQKKYCIFNKQYTKEEYERLAPKIMERMKKDKEWGEYFPIETNPFYFNKTVAFDYFPLSKEEALRRGYHWKETENEVPDVKKIIPGDKLPERINEVPDLSAVAANDPAKADDVLQWAVRCSATNRPFRIVKQELAFYRQFGLPLPDLHPDERYTRRLALRNPRKLYDRQCSICKKDLQTTYQPSRPEKIYCEDCYRKAVY